MRIEDQRPARLYQIGGNTCITIPRAYCRQLGLTPRTFVTLTLRDDDCIVIYHRKEEPSERTPIRRSTPSPAQRARRPAP